MVVQGFAIENHEFKNLHESARHMKFLFTAVQVTGIMSGKPGRLHVQNTFEGQNSLGEWKFYGQYVSLKFLMDGQCACHF